MHTKKIRFVIFISAETRNKGPDPKHKVYQIYLHELITTMHELNLPLTN
jgi:hypothetical protein